MSRGERDPYSRRTLHAKSLNPNINFRLPSKKKKKKRKRAWDERRERPRIQRNTY